jgi:hypothetical protein
VVRQGGNALGRWGEIPTRDSILSGFERLCRVMLIFQKLVFLEIRPLCTCPATILSVVLPCIRKEEHKTEQAGCSKSRAIVSTLRTGVVYLPIRREQWFCASSLNTIEQLPQPWTKLFRSVCFLLVLGRGVVRIGVWFVVLVCCDGHHVVVDGTRGKLGMVDLRDLHAHRDLGCPTTRHGG